MCNTTPDEDVYAGMRAATELQWTAEPGKRFIIVIGDNPAHPGEGEPAQQLARDWGAKGSHLSTLRIENPVALPGTANSTSSIARSGNGTALLPGSSFALSILSA
ncbi:MAG: hypothetical protein WDN44_00880 [Sphingomonas sp.]